MIVRMQNFGWKSLVSYYNKAGIDNWSRISLTKEIPTIHSSLRVKTYSRSLLDIYARLLTSGIPVNTRSAKVTTTLSPAVRLSNHSNFFSIIPSENIYCSLFCGVLKTLVKVYIESDIEFKSAVS